MRAAGAGWKVSRCRAGGCGIGTGSRYSTEPSRLLPFAMNESPAQSNEEWTIARPGDHRLLHPIVGVKLERQCRHRFVSVHEEAGVNKHNLRAVPALLVGIALGSTAAASPFSMPSRTMFGPSLNKEVPVTSAGPGAIATTPAAPSTPAAQSTPAAPSTNIMPTMPTTPMSPSQQSNFQPAPKPTAMERAGQMVRSVLQKIDPSAKSVLHRDGVDLNGGSNTPSVISTQSSAISTNGAPPTVNNANAASTAPGNGSTSTTAAPQASGINTSMNKQERKVSPDAAREVHQLQRGIMNEQKVNVGSIQ